MSYRSDPWRTRLAAAIAVPAPPSATCMVCTAEVAPLVNSGGLRWCPVCQLYVPSVPVVPTEPVTEGDQRIRFREFL